VKEESEDSSKVLSPAASISAPASGFSNTLRKISKLARKELRESLRDRRTLATLVVMPLIVYPLLGSVVQKFAVSRIDLNAPAAAVVIDQTLSPGLQSLFAVPDVGENEAPASDDADDAPKSGDSQNRLEDLTKQLLEGKLPDGQNSIDGVETAIQLEKYIQPPGTDLEAIVRNGIADIAVLETLPQQDPATGVATQGEIRVIARQGDAFSTKAATEAVRRISAFRDEYVRAVLDQTRFGRQVMPAISRVSLQSTGPKESPLSAFVPLMLVLMTMTGAVYPAIDLTAGERERGTLEMLIAAPVSRRNLLTGKFIAVFTVAVLTAIINLTAMILTLYGTGFDRVILGEGASIGMFLQVLSLLVVFASFFSAVLLSITSFARSFREAQAWLIPLMLVSLAPGILSLMPGVRLTIGLALLPLVNIVLLGKELFQGIAAPHLFIITLVATLTYTVLALRLAANVFGSDSVLFANNSGGGGLSKRPAELTDEVSKSLGIGYLLALLPAFIVLAGMRGRLVDPANLSGQVVLSGLMTVLLFTIFPALLTTWNRVRATSAYAIRSFSPLALLGAILLGATLWTLSYEALLFGKGTAAWTKLLSNPKLQELAQRLTQETPLLLRLLTLAVIPAICEELFFRGFLMSALLGRSERWKSALFTSTFLFAAFHVVVDQSLTLERFPATFMLGFVLGWIRLSTGSIFPGIVMHAVSNGLLLSLTELQPLLARLGLDLAVKNETHLPAWFLAVSSGLSLIGAILIYRSSRRAKLS
jgi:sodium transport system permease protein